MFTEPEYVPGVNRLGLMPAMAVPGVVPLPAASSQLPPVEVDVLTPKGNGAPWLLTTPDCSGGLACPTWQEKDIPKGLIENVDRLLTVSVTFTVWGLLPASSATIV